MIWKIIFFWRKRLGYSICGLLIVIAVFVFSEYVFNKALVESTGTTYSELSRMKEECELTIPRNQHCAASIIFLPTASEE